MACDNIAFRGRTFKEGPRPGWARLDIVTRGDTRARHEDYDIVTDTRTTANYRYEDDDTDTRTTAKRCYTSVKKYKEYLLMCNISLKV